MLPPPAPIVFTSTIGVRTGYGPIDPSPASSGAPACTTPTSLLVPPMSSETKSRTPERSAAKRAPITPPAGPDRNNVTGCRAASAADTMPPRDRMMSGGALTPIPRKVSASPAR
jgi:hypothetical protein